MLPRKLLSDSAALVGHELLPRYLLARDYPWLSELIERFHDCVGRPRCELAARLAQPLAQRSPRGKRRVAAFTLQRLARDQRDAGQGSARLLRSALFVAAASRDRPQAAVVAEVAARHELSPDALERALFADLPGQRLVAEAGLPMSAARLAEEANFAIASSLVGRAARLTIATDDDPRGLFRHTHTSGLIARATEGLASAVRLQVSGPFSLFRHTQVYRRALVALLPRLTWCRRFELNAECPLRGSSASVHFTLKSGDPIGVARALSARRAKTEERFVRDFARQAPDWELSADPAPLRAGSRLISADFALTRRGEPSRKVLLAIAGYWTSHFVRDLQRDLAGAGLPPLILCLDENKACDSSALAAGVRLLRFRGRIAVRDLLSLLESDLS